MKRTLAFAVALLLVAGTAFGWPLARVWKGGLPWWYGGLTFWAPFDDSASPLKLNVGTGSLSFTRATTATRVATDNGYITSTPSGTLRIESNGALIEGQRTNKALYSEQLGLAANWVATNVTVDNNTAITDPAGGTAAETLTASDANGTLTQSIATDNSVTHTFSIYLKRKTGTGAVQLNADNTTYAACTINATTWTRCSVSNALTDNTAAHSPGVRLVTSGDAVYAYGAGYEASSFPSSYIPTTTAAVTRNADILKTQISGNVPQSEFTITFDTMRNYQLTTFSVDTNIFAFGDYAANAYMSFGRSYVNDFGSMLVNFGAYWSYASAFSYDRVFNSLEKGAFRLGSDLKTMDLYINGTKDATTAVAAQAKSAAWNSNTFYIGGNNTGVDVTQRLYIKNLRIWNRAFTDAEMQVITQ